MVAMAWIARSLGPENQGRFGFVHWLAAMVAQASVWGLGVTSTRFVAASLGDRDPHAAAETVRLTTRWLLITLLAVGGAAVRGGPFGVSVAPGPAHALRLRPPPQPAGCGRAHGPMLVWAIDALGHPVPDAAFEPLLLADDVALQTARRSRDTTKLWRVICRSIETAICIHTHVPPDMQRSYQGHGVPNMRTIKAAGSPKLNKEKSDIATNTLSKEGKRLRQQTLRLHQWTRRLIAEGKADLVTFSYSISMIPDWFKAIQHAQSLLTKPGSAANGFLGVVDFYISRKYPDEGMKFHPWFQRNFWRLWFANDNVNLNPDHVPYIQSRFATETLREETAPVPYIGLIMPEVPIYSFIGQAK